MNRITVVLADDHRLVRQGLIGLLGSETGITVVGEAADGIEACALVEKLQPDVLILDLLMPGLGGLEVLRRLRQIGSPTRVLILSMYADEAYVLEALRSGATGYLLKDAQASELIQAVLRVATGQRYLSQPLAERALDAYLMRAEGGTVDPLYALTDREREVLHLAASGHTSAQIAAMLTISTRTAETHRAHLMKKLGLRSQVEILRFATEHGLLLRPPAQPELTAPALP